MAKNWTLISKKYGGSWVALDRNEETVVASAKTAKEAWLKAQEKGYRKPILTRVPKKVMTYVGLEHEVRL